MTTTGQRLGASMLIVSGGILLSRVLGLVRDVVFARSWGTEEAAFAAFVIAFTIPNLFRALFGEGAFAAAFVPVFSERLEKNGLPDAWAAAQRIISVLILLMLGVVVAIAAVSLAVRPFMDRELTVLTFRFLPWLMPYALLICVTAAFAAVLNSLRHFAVPAVTPVILNLVLILTALFACPLAGTAAGDQVMLLTWAVLVAGILQLGAQVIACRRRGLVFRFAPDRHAPEVGKVALLMAPVLLGTGVAQINVAVDRFLAGYLGISATTSLYYSQRLVYLPVALFGVAMAVVCLPAMSRAWSRNEHEHMLDSLLYALRHALFLAIPVAALLGLLATPVVKLIFERGTFGAQSTAETVWALAFYLPGVPAFACAKIAVTPFYARQDTTTPVRIAVGCMLLNVVLNLTLMWFLRQGGLALATSICSYVNVTLLLWFLSRKLGRLHLARLIPALLRIGTATCVALLAAGVVSRWAAAAQPGPGLGARLVAVLLPLGVGLVCYVITAWALGAPEVRQLAACVLRRANDDAPRE